LVELELFTPAADYCTEVSWSTYEHGH
jgi:hypothetical protein